MLKLSGVLLIVALGCALTLAVIYGKTAPLIEKQKQVLLENSLRSILKAHSYKEQNDIAPSYYTAYDEAGNVVGWCLQLASQGYAGKIQLLVGVDMERRITGIKVLEQKETPGLGSKINELEYRQTEPAFLKQFKNKKADELILVKGKTEKNIQAVTGATISSKAVTEGVRKGLEGFFKEKSRQAGILW